MSHIKHGSADTGIPTEQLRTTSGSYSTTSSRPKYMDHDDDSLAPIVLILIMIAHLVLVILRATEVIMWSWWIILIPELFVVVGLIELVFFVLLAHIRDRNRRRIHNGN